VAVELRRLLGARASISPRGVAIAPVAAMKRRVTWVNCIFDVIGGGGGAVVVVVADE
jgi:hypothetical protein